MSPESMTVAALALGSAACYGLGLVLAQIGLRGGSVLASAAVTLPTTATALWLWAAFRLDLAPFDPTALAIFAACGLMFPVAVTLLSFQANRVLGPNLAGALVNATPLFAVAFGILILDERLTAQQLLGLATVVGGVVMLSGRRRDDGRRWSLAALLLPVAAAAIRGLVQPAVKLGLARWPDPFVATLTGYTMSALVILAALLLRRREARPAWQPRSIPILMLVGLSNGTSLLLLYAALNAGRVALVAPLVAANPFFTLAFSAVLLRGEPVHPRLLLGIAATVVGVVLVLAS